MEDRHLYKAKRVDNGEWVEWNALAGMPHSTSILSNTVCQCTGLKDKNGNLIWENDILMCHGNPVDIVKAVFGEFSVINAETLEDVDKVIGWHYEVIPTDALSKCEPFCLSMPITDEYVNTCEFEIIGNIFDNSELQRN